MRKGNGVKAILCSDIHFSHKAPVFRSNEPNWYEAQKRPIEEIGALSKQYGCPVIIAGDIFDRWNSPPELINFVISQFWLIENRVYALAGQHDLPNHNLQDMNRSALETIFLSECVTLLTRGMSVGENIRCWAFHWNQEVHPPIEPNDRFMDIAAIHSYIWKKGSGYPGADEEKLVSKWVSKLEGYKVAAFGDNHKGFCISNGKLTILNCGTLMRRKSDEVDYKPMVGLLEDDGSVTVHYLDTSKDKHLDVEDAKDKEDVDVEALEFIKELKALDADSLDFRDSMRQYIEAASLNRRVKELITQCME